MALDEVFTCFSRISASLSTIKVKSVYVHWQGGEILTLKPEWCLHAGRTINECMAKKNITVRQFLQTNLLAYDKAWDPVLWEIFSGSIGSSVDFPNLYRKTPTVSVIEYNHKWAFTLNWLETRGFDVSAIAVVNHASLELLPSEFLGYFVDYLGLSRLQVNTPFPGGAAARLKNELLLEPERLGDFLAGLIQVWMGGGRTLRLQPFESLGQHMMMRGTESGIPCIFSTNCVNEFLCVGPEGEIGLCDCWVTSYPGSSFGNIIESDDLNSILLSAKRLELATRPSVLISQKECGECEYLSLCHGGCPVRAMSAYGSPNHKDPYCKTYKRVFEALGSLRRSAGDRTKRH